MFVRVKSAVKSDPQHEFDVSEVELRAHPKKYAVVDKNPVVDVRPATYVAKASKRAVDHDKKSD